MKSNNTSFAKPKIKTQLFIMSSILIITLGIVLLILVMIASQLNQVGIETVDV